MITKQTQKQVLEWLANGQTGISSETMAFWLAFAIKKDDCCHPWDPADFNRCLLLLNAAPALREHLFRMKKVSPVWKRLVERWTEIEALFLEEVGLGWSKAHSAPRTYALMKKVISE